MLIERTISDSTLVALLFLAIALLFLLIRKTSPTKVQIAVASYFSNRTFKQHLKEEYFIKNYTIFFMGLLSALSLSTSLALTERVVSYPSIFSKLGLVLAFLGIKVALSYGLTKAVSPFQTVIKSVYTLEVLCLIVSGIFSTAFIPLELFYSVYSVKELLFVVLIVIYAIKLTKQFLYSVENKVSLFYIILYFCAFELIPALSLLKVLRIV